MSQQYNQINSGQDCKQYNQKAGGSEKAALKRVCKWPTLQLDLVLICFRKHSFTAPFVPQSPLSS